jgi:hypothetical protein
MYVKNLIFAILLFIVPTLVKAQTYVYSYADPCTGIVKTINVPTNGVTVTYFGQMNTFNPADFTNGNFNNWANGVYSSFGGNNPCGSTIGISTSVSMAQNTAMNVLGIMNTLDALSSISGGGLNTNGVTESSKTESKSSNKKNNKKNNSDGSTTGGTTEGSGSTGGTTGSNGSTTGGTTGSNGSATSGGTTEGSGSTTTGGSTTGSNGSTTTGGTTGSNGSTTTGGTTTGSNGSTTSGGATGTNGSTTTGGTTTGSNGSTTSGGTTGTDGSTKTGGTTGSNGSTTSGGTTGSTTSGGTTGSNGSTTGGGTTEGSGSTAGGGTTEGSGSTTTTGGTTTGSTAGGTTEGSGSTTTSGTTGSNGSTTTGGSGSGSTPNNNSTGSDAATNEEKKSSNILGGSVGSIQNATSTSTTSSKGGSSAPTKGNAPTIVLSSDFAGFNFKSGDATYGGKGTAGWTSLNWDGTRSHGFMLDYTSANKGPNFTAFYASIKKRRIDLISVTGTTSFYGKGSLYGTVALGQMWSFPKVKNLKAIYMATSSYGNVYGTKFIGTAFIAGGMYDFKIGKRTQIKLTNLFIYAPYISYYNDMVLKSPYVIMPIIGTNIGVTKKFKLNVNFGGTYAVGENVLNFTVMMGTRFAL